MVRIKIEISRGDDVEQVDWIEVEEHRYRMFETRLWGWNPANFIGRLLVKMIDGRKGMDRLTPQRYADKARWEIDNP